MDVRKMLVLSTAAAALLAVIAMLSLEPFGLVSEDSHPQLLSNERLSPVFGDRQAPIEVVVFEDLKCQSCRIFSEQVLPRIESEYLASEKIRLKIVPLGFLTGSKILANAALEVYQLSPTGFLPYVKLVFAHLKHDPVGQSMNQTLLELAAEIGGVDLVSLKTCIEQGCHYKELDRNLAQARTLMGKKIRIPALYVNGIRVDTLDYQAIQQAIERAAQ